jgi:hypothetical protein
MQTVTKIKHSFSRAYLMMENPGEDWGKPYYPVVNG